MIRMLASNTQMPRIQIESKKDFEFIRKELRDYAFAAMQNLSVDNQTEELAYKVEQVRIIHF
jgi:hypothetical protein